MKRYHPHGDNSIYPTLARMGQWWNSRHLLITGQGNFGSIHGLPPAAMRYTEAKLSPVAAEMLEDIKLDTVDFQPNYDEKYQEPRVLPGKFPNLLVNGSGGIAVGMATSIPPHNLGEVCDALVALIDNPQIELDELLEHISGPDFPTGARSAAAGAFARRTGPAGARSSSVPSTRSRSSRTAGRTSSSPRSPTSSPRSRSSRSWPSWSTPVGSPASRTSTTTATASSRCGSSSPSSGARTPTSSSTSSYQFSPLQDTFSVIMLALVDGRPQTLPLKDFLRLFVEHRLNVIRRRTQFQLREARKRAISSKDS